MIKYSSNAEWEKIGPTCDIHRSKEEAQSVCDSLLRDFNSEPGCPIRGVCKRAWVEEINDYSKTNLNLYHNSDS